ncbi:MAG: biopolymer transporter ExbD [Planctomycetes bacterium]|nr:biopolymer transporter ExbD [Planctomycetota bacterium]
MSAVFRRGRAEVEANLTPMIDVAFLLIVFFVVVSQIVEIESVQLDLPAPQDPASERPGEEQRAVINVIPAAGGKTLGYRLGSRVFAADTQGIEAMTAELAALYQRNPTLDINLRADRTTHYEWVEPALQAVSTAARLSGRPDVRARINLVVVRED